MKIKSLLLPVLMLSPVLADDPWLVYEGGEGPGKDRHVVLLSGDEEYRSEEAMPMLGKLLAELRDIRLDQARVLERMARVEKRLKTQAGAA